MNYADKVVHIIGTYRLPLQSQVLESFRCDMRDSTPRDRNRIAEEGAAIFLARRLYPMVMAELRSGIDCRATGGILDAWSKFTQQAMYRSDLGLINLVLFNDEILPLIDDVERILREEFPTGQGSQTEAAARGPGVVL